MHNISIGVGIELEHLQPTGFDEIGRFQQYATIYPGKCCPVPWIRADSDTSNCRPCWRSRRWRTADSIRIRPHLPDQTLDQCSSRLKSESKSIKSTCTEAGVVFGRVAVRALAFEWADDIDARPVDARRGEALVEICNVCKGSARQHNRMHRAVKTERSKPMQTFLSSVNPGSHTHM